MTSVMVVVAVLVIEKTSTVEEGVGIRIRLDSASIIILEDGLGGRGLEEDGLGKGLEEKDSIITLLDASIITTLELGAAGSSVEEGAKEEEEDGGLVMREEVGMGVSKGKRMLLELKSGMKSMREEVEVISFVEEEEISGMEELCAVTVFSSMHSVSRTTRI